MSELIAIQIYLDKNEAEIAKGLLDQNGIQSTISADDVGGYIPHIPYGKDGIKLLIDTKDLIKAKDVLKTTEINLEDEELENYKIQNKIKSLPTLYCALIFMFLLILVIIVGIFISPLREGRPFFIFLAVALGLLFVYSIRYLRTILTLKKNIPKQPITLIRPPGVNEEK